MSYADGLLATNERIMRRERQHWMFPLLVAGRYVAIAIGIVIVGFLLVQLLDPSDDGGIIDSTVSFVQTVVGILTWIALAFAVIGLVWSTIQWQTQEYILTDRRVMHVKGVINKQSTDASLENITDAQITIPWIGRIAGFGDLIFLTAAEAGLVNLRTLKNPIEFKKDLMDAKNDRLIEINQARFPAPPVRTDASPVAPVASAAAPVAAPVAAAPPVAPAAPLAPAAAPPEAPAAPAPASVAPVAAPSAPVAPAPTPAAPPAASTEDVAKTLASLAALRDSGVITAEDYEAKKAQLLERI